jgi:hypothetical protein
MRARTQARDRILRKDFREQTSLACGRGCTMLAGGRHGRNTPDSRISRTAAQPGLPRTTGKQRMGYLLSTKQFALMC